LGVIFDFGDTLLHYASADWTAGCKKLLDLADDSRGITPKEVKSLSDEMSHEVFTARLNSAIELHYDDFIRLLCETLGISLNVSYAEAAQQMWHASIVYEPVPGIFGILQRLQSSGVKMGILSNSVFSGSVLREELAKQRMDIFFSFVISSADYGLGKPHHRITELAVKKMGFPAHDIWLVGDKLDYDVRGALSCGLFPVWFNAAKATGKLAGDYIEVENWAQFEEKIGPLLD